MRTINALLLYIYYKQLVNLNPKKICEISTGGKKINAEFTFDLLSCSEAFFSALFRRGEKAVNATKKRNDRRKKRANATEKTKATATGKRGDRHDKKRTTAAENAERKPTAKKQIDGKKSKSTKKGSKRLLFSQKRLIMSGRETLFLHKG